MHWGLGLKRPSDSKIKEDENMAALAILIYVLFACGKVDSAINNIEPITKTVGESADFLWNASLFPIIGSQWGLKDPSGGNPPNPLFISTTITSKNVSFGDDLDTVALSYKNRVHFIGNLSIGRAWFRITDLNTSDTNQYRATIQENTQPILPFTVLLTVLPKGITTTTTLPTSRVTTGNHSTTTPTPTTPSTIPAPSNNYVVILNGTFNVTKDNNCSDIEWYIKDQTKVVFSSLLDSYNVTVKCKAKPQSSLWFVVNLTFWFNFAVNKSFVESKVEILQHNIRSTSHFSFTVIAKHGALPPATDGPPPTPGLTKAEIAGIVIGVILGVVIIAVIIVILYKKFSNKSQDDNRPTDKMQGKVADQETEMKTSSAAKA